MKYERNYSTQCAGWQSEIVVYIIGAAHVAARRLDAVSNAAWYFQTVPL